MRIGYSVLVLLLGFGAGCSSDRGPATPIDTFKTYAKAAKQKDTNSMKLLLSDSSLKMHEEEARSQNVKVDEIIARETLFSSDQRKIEFRNESVEGERATIEIKNAFGSWETVPFVFEDGQWKLDKKQFADRLLEDVEMRNQQLRQQIEQGRPPDTVAP